MNLLIVTQKVNTEDQILGFFHQWLLSFSDKVNNLTIICLEKGENNLSDLDNVKILSLKKELGSSKISRFLNCFKFILKEKNNYDVVLVHMNPIYIVLFGFIWKVFKKPIFLWYTHKHVDWKLKISNLFVERIFTASDKSLRLETDKKKVMGHGIDTELFKPNEDSELDEVKNILTVGRISESKQTLEIIKMAENFNDSDLILNIIGSPITEKDEEYYKDCLKYVEENNLKEKVIFHGSVKHSDTPKFYKEADVFINLSNTGSLDKVILEAMSSGCMVITSNEAVSGVSNIYFIDKDLKIEEVNLDKILEEYGNQESLSLARNYVIKNHSLENLIDRLIIELKNINPKNKFKINLNTNLKKELFYIKKSFLMYKRGFTYLYYRFIFAKLFFLNKKSLEKPITHENFSIHVLTGHSDFIYALWSLYSYYKNVEAIGNLYIHNDGTLTSRDKKKLKKHFPNHKIFNVNNYLENYETKLEDESLKKFRSIYKKFQSKKLLDPIHTSKEDNILILDSDMIWFKNSDEIVESLNNNCDKSLMMSNGKEEFVHVEFKDGTKTSEEIANANSGITLFNKSNYSFDKVIEYINKADYMNKKFTDQACYASILDNVEILSADTYIIKGTLTDEIVMRHYTSPSRAKFFIYGVNLLEK